MCCYFKTRAFLYNLCYLKHRDLVHENSFLFTVKQSRVTGIFQISFGPVYVKSPLESDAGTRALYLLQSIYLNYKQLLFTVICFCNGALIICHAIELCCLQSPLYFVYFPLFPLSITVDTLLFLQFCLSQLSCFGSSTCFSDGVFSHFSLGCLAS